MFKSSAVTIIILFYFSSVSSLPSYSFDSEKCASLSNFGDSFQYICASASLQNSTLQIRCPFDDMMIDTVISANWGLLSTPQYNQICYANNYDDVLFNQTCTIPSHRVVRSIIADCVNNHNCIIPIDVAHWYSVWHTFDEKDCGDDPSKIILSVNYTCSRKPTTTCYLYRHVLLVWKGKNSRHIWSIILAISMDDTWQWKFVCEDWRGM